MSWTSEKSDIDKIIEYIQSEIGIVIKPHQKESLNDYLKEIAKTSSYTSMDEYLKELKKEKHNLLLYHQLIDRITIGESYFNRDISQMNIIKNSILPEIIDKKRRSNNKTLRIWSAGCSAGQEIYGIAIMLKDIIPDIKHWNITLIGTDINIAALNQARAGIYSPWSFRGTDEQIIKRNFHKVNEEYYLKSDIKGMVKFYYHNLHDNNYPSIINGLNNFDLVLCRNVVMYFEKSNIPVVINRICNSLIEEGVMLLGAVEEGCCVIQCLERKINDGVIFYEKNSKTHEENVITVHEKVHDAVSKNTIVSLHEEKIASGLQEAIMLANLGRFNEAIDLCKKLTEQDELNPFNYFVYALILKELNNLEGAVVQLKKSIFLDNKFIEAHYCLGLLLLQQNKLQNGLKEFMTTLEMLKRADLEKKLYIDPDLSYVDLLNMVKNEIIHCQNVSRGTL